MYVCINSESTCSVEVFLSLARHFMKVVCCVKLSKLCPKVFVECYSFVFLGEQFVQSKVCFVKVTFHQVHTIIKRLSICAPCQVAFDLCICFLIYVLLEDTDVNSVGHQPLLCMCKVDVCGYAKVVMCATLA
jgi:hypothetical protein